MLLMVLILIILSMKILNLIPTAYKITVVPLRTIALLANSPAIDTGSNPEGLIFDQRGDAFPRIISSRADMGAFESPVLVVNTSVDENDGIDLGDISLREALLYIGDSGTIIFADSIANGTITLTQGQLTIDKSLTIDGDEENITISGNNASRVFNIDDGSNDIQTVQINGLTISGGSVSGNGAGIFNRENLTLSNSTISNNSANNGGGIDNSDGTANISNSTISNNSASSRGGGIINFDGTANISNSTISNNSASSFGGGIDNSDGTANISNSTISNNSASFKGGGIYQYDGTANISNSTISDNSANLNGGGIYQYYGRTNIISSIVSGNNATNSGDEVFNYSGTINADNNNLFGDIGKDNSNAFSGFTPDITGSDITATSDGTNPTALTDILDPNGLQDNGGPTETIALVSGSPAIDAGSNPDNLITDQRGADRDDGNGVDIGAFELTTEIIVDTLEDENDGDFSEGDRSLTRSITLYRRQWNHHFC